MIEPSAGLPHSPARRRFVAGAAGVLLMPARLLAQSSVVVPFGAGELVLLSDGNMSLPVSIALHDDMPASELEPLRAGAGLAGDTYSQPLNVTLWRQGERTVLFDMGSGLQFLDGTGLLSESLAAAGIDPAEITDVVLTHAHPDHLWGALDDFDELLFAEARYYLHGTEFDYWMADDTLSNTPEARQSFVVGAQSRLPLIEERLTRFDWGDELLPGIEAVDSRGHTPGHTSFVLHTVGSDPVTVIGDALLNPVLSFARPAWPAGSDQDPGLAAATRARLLDRMAGDRLRAVGYHLPTPGLGRVERDGGAYRWLEGA